MLLSNCAGIVKYEVVGIFGIYAWEHDAFDRQEQRHFERLADNLAYSIAVQRLRLDRERVARNLVTAEAQFHAIFDQAAVGIVRVTRAGRFGVVWPWKHRCMRASLVV